MYLVSFLLKSHAKLLFSLHISKGIYIFFSFIKEIAGNGTKTIIQIPKQHRKIKPKPINLCVTNTNDKNSFLGFPLMRKIPLKGDNDIRYKAVWMLAFGAELELIMLILRQEYLSQKGVLMVFVILYNMLLAGKWFYSHLPANSRTEAQSAKTSRRVFPVFFC